MAEKKENEQGKKKGLLGRFLEKLNKKMEETVKKTSCCGFDNNNKKGSSCC